MQIPESEGMKLGKVLNEVELQLIKSLSRALHGKQLHYSPSIQVKNK